MKENLRARALTLRPFDMDDVEALHAIFSDPLTHTIGDGPFTDIEQTRSWIKNRAQRRKEHGVVWYAVRLPTGDLIGNCGLFIGRTGAEPELGFEIAHAHQGHGYATSAGTAVVAEAHRAGFPVVWATARPHNHASLAALGRSGFQRHHIENDGKGRLIYLLHQ
ncbi:GNAT family N-acetyltransferase [Leekyejoonella antrihumi]|uniref:GNAT family N-acetyltransferase n=1 Tax=Leekyejoonella antrihumi TaxID=1660198 RepID=A0A563DPH1_9MICO|nr:GNAT family N-acetyltransferase [Leekyejoonella antrihumi]TWP32066.1 GNAT family N-acetyltransferase [Leekyejoonella antrihumi]